MLKAIKIRIYPSEEQINFINRQLGCCRLVYNKCLSFREEIYKEEHRTASQTETSRFATALKAENPFLREVHSKVLQQAVIDLNRAYDNYFNHHKKHPKFKTKHMHKQTCRFPKDAFMEVRGNRISLVKALKNIHFKCSRRDENYLNKYQDKIKSLTLVKTCADKFYLSVIIECPLKLLPQVNGAVGIDLGLKDMVITSDGEVFDNIKFKSSLNNKIKRAQRKLSKKQLGSNNRNKARIKYAKLCEKVQNQKFYHLHKIANQLLNENQVIVMENLKLGWIFKNHRLANSASETCLGKLRRILEYKAKWYNRQLVFVDRFYPSSKKCNHCGFVNKDLKLEDRQWKCPQCGAIIDRDYNAALNILEEGLRIIGLSSPEFKPEDCPTMDDKVVIPLKSSGRMRQEKNESYV